MSDYKDEIAAIVHDAVEIKAEVASFTVKAKALVGRIEQLNTRMQRERPEVAAQIAPAMESLRASMAALGGNLH